MYLGSYSYIPYSEKTLAVKKRWRIWRITAFRQVLCNFHNIPYADGLQFAKVFRQTSYNPYTPNFFTAKVFYCMVVNMQSYI